MPENAVRMPTWSGPTSGTVISRISTRFGSGNTTAWVFTRPLLLEIRTWGTDGGLGSLKAVRTIS
jgi:hypothetical protein